ncbi:MAG TPA: nuclear transport factor 2 family protein [Candidatus Baltobacteraceae bacterium]|jgi:ketosteroid isomerase-like protein|nr:nuclear transport factor 2 family protein [Candidatus Baltobacteraceae bacterium]
MRITAFAIGLFAMIVGLVCAPTPAFAAGSGQPAAVLNQAISAFNKGDMKAWTAICDSPAVAIDDFAPHLWQGPAACTDWSRDFTAMTKQQGIKSGTVTLGPVWHSAVTGNRAYLVYPATFSFQQKGKMMNTGGIFTFVMNKTANGWRVAAWSWADRH